MPSTYTGTGTDITNRTAVSGTIPSDGDAESAASVNTPLETIIDVLSSLKKSAGLQKLASTWEALQTFQAGITVSAGTTEIQDLDCDGGADIAGGATIDDLTVTGTFSPPGGGITHLGPPSGWSENSGALEVAVFKDSFGNVRLEGQMSKNSGTATSVSLPTLPSGMRPQGSCVLPCVLTSSSTSPAIMAGQATILSSGACTVAALDGSPFDNVNLGVGFNVNVPSA